MTENLLVRSDGTIQAIGDLRLEIRELGRCTKKRATRIVPVHRGKRFAFLLLRSFFGDHGDIAAWTREWSGPWLAVIFATQESFTAQDRADCIRWEQERLMRHLSLQ